MKKIKRFLVGLFACVCLGVGTMGLVACGGVTVNPNNQGGVTITPGASTDDSQGGNVHVHTWEETVITEVSCTTTGVSLLSCSCGEEKVETTPNLGHERVRVDAKVPTCTEFGWATYVVCQREGCGYTTYEEIPETGHVYTYNACELCGLVASHLSATKAEQAKQKYVNDGEDTEEYEAEFMAAYDQGDIRFLQYRIGTIKNCLVQTLMTPIQNVVGMDTMTFTINELTSTSISNGISNSISTTNTVSVAQSEKQSLTWDYSTGIGISGKISVGVEVGVTMKAEVGTTISTAYSIGETFESGQTNERSKSVAESICKAYNMEELNQQSQGVSFVLNMEKMTKGLFYALCLVADIEVYQIIGYNIYTGELYTTYFVSSMEKNRGMSVLSSESIGFNIDTDYQLSPITEINVELKEMKFVGINFEENGGEEITNFLIRENQSMADRLPTPERKHYTFEGWYLSEDFDPATRVYEHTVFSNNCTLYAKWAAEEYEIEWDLNGGTISTTLPDSYKYGEGISKEEMIFPTYEGRIFCGWQDREDGYISSIGPYEYGDKYISAKWIDDTTESLYHEISMTYKTASTSFDISTPEDEKVEIKVPDALKNLAIDGRVYIEMEVTFKISVISTGNATTNLEAYLDVGGSKYFACSASAKGGGYSIGGIYKLPYEGNTVTNSGTVYYGGKVTPQIKVGANFTMTSNKTNDLVYCKVESECTQITYRFYVE